MRIGSRVKTWWQKRSTKYAAAGTLLLALAGVALALSVGNGAQAAESIEELNNNGGQISTAEEFELLRSDDASGSYTLEKDITIESIDDAATGILSGTLDGGGHVITINNIEIEDYADENVSHGILFGEVTGTVKNLIVNIEDEDASYTRTSSAGVNDTSASSEVSLIGEPVTSKYDESTVLSSASTDADVNSFIKNNLSDSLYYVLANGEFTDESPDDDIDYTAYKRETKTQNVTETVTCDLSDPQNDAFGVICGTLGSNASVSQVEVQGGTLTVTQNASSVQYQTTQDGTRDQYFYYKVETGMTDKISAGSANVSTTVNGITVYDPGEVTGNSSTETGTLYVEASAPQYVQDGSKLEYTVIVTNNSEANITGISLTSSLSGGSWSNDSEAVYTNFDLNSGDDISFTYTIISASSAVSTESGTYNDVTFTAKWGDTSAPQEAKTNALSTDVITPGSEISITGTVNNNLKITLTTDKSNYFVGEEIELTLTLENTWTASTDSNDQTGKEITISALPIGTVTGTGINNGGINWSNDSGIKLEGGQNKVYEIVYSLDDLNLTNNNSVTLTISTGEVTGSCTNIFENVTHYTYVSYDNMGVNSNTDETGWKYGEVNRSGSLVEQNTTQLSANNLSAGVIAGISSGSITEVKQDLTMSGVIAKVSNNGADLTVGGIAGQIDNTSGSVTLSDLYIQKTAQASIADTGYDASDVSAAAGTVAGNVEGSVTLSASLILGGSLGTGIEANNVYYTIDNGIASLVTEEGAWNSFEYYTEDGTEAVLDLSWLVKEPEFSTSFSASDGTLTVSFPENETPERSSLEYCFAYEARKSMGETDDYIQYVHDDTSSVIDLGSSAYYCLNSLYATDGFYHYIQEIEEESQETVFPYDNNVTTSPYQPSSSKVARQSDGSDRIAVTFTNTLPDRQNQVLYYNAGGNIPTNSDQHVNIENSEALLPFDTASVQYQITPVIDGHIYPTETLDEFDADDREPLPRPGLTISTAFDEDGNPVDYDPINFAAGYKSGNRVKAEIEETELSDCILQYLFSTEILDSEEFWDGSTGRYTGSNDIDTLMSESTLYSEYMELPEVDERTQYYLYIQVSKENYNDALYRYGPITVNQQDRITAQAFIPETNTILGEGETVVTGDVLELSCNGDSSSYTLQYSIQDSQEAAHSWKDYDSSSCPQFTGGTGAEIYVYTRVRYSDNSYSETTLHTFTAGGNCSAVRITPNTGSSTTSDAPDEGSASVIDAGEVVNLTSQTTGAKIVYLTSEASYSLFGVERVTRLPDGIQNDGDKDAGYTYFKVGERWYRVSSAEVSVYNAADGVVIHNEETAEQTVYVYTVSFAEGMEPGTATAYRYRVNPQQQVETPEAALSTHYLPGGDSLEQTEVEMGASLSFSTATAGADLYYSIGNGAETPDQLYDSASGIEVDGTYGGTFVVRVMATREGMLDSEIRTFVYRIAEQDPADAPTSVPSTSAASPTTVIPGDKILLSTVTRGATIYYTTDGTSPQVEEQSDGSFKIVEGSSTLLYDATQGIEMPVGGSGYFTIKAVAARTGLALSSEVHLTFAYPDDVQSPYASVSSGSVSASTQVVLRNRTADAVIYYTVAYDGQTPADPTVSSAVFDESQPFVITRETRIKAIAVKDGVISDVASFNYTLMDTLAAPTASIESGSMVARGTVLQLEAASGATIYYTMDGSDPSDLSNTAVVQGSSLTLNGEAGGQITIMAMARQEGKTDSEVVTCTYQFSASSGGVTADVPTGSEVSNGSKVNLMTDVTGATIYYTTDGSSPATGGTEGSTVTVQGTPGSTFTIKAVARVDGVSGTVVSFMYRIKEVPNAPTASPSGGTLTVATRVTLSSNSGQIYYTTDGTTPTESSSLYTEPILINRTTNLRAISVSDDGEVSEVVSFQYTAASKAAAPESSRADGELLEPGSVVSLYTDTSGAVIYYTTDGMEPTPDNLESLLQYTEEGITVNRTVTIKAAAYREDLQLSDVSEFHYEVETIPAVEMKRAEAERLAQEGLHDTDASGLARRESGESDTDMRQLEETEYYTVASFAREAAADNVRLVTTLKSYTSTELDNVKQIYGEDYTILSSYDIRLMVGSTTVRPDGDTEIGIPIPAAYENAAVVIASVGENSRLSSLETRREDGMVYTYMDDQNHYILIGLEHPESSGFRINYLLILEITAGLTAAAGIAYYIRRKWKRYKENS